MSELPKSTINYVHSRPDIQITSYGEHSRVISAGVALTEELIRLGIEVSHTADWPPGGFMQIRLGESVAIATIYEGYEEDNVPEHLTANSRRPWLGTYPEVLEELSQNGVNFMEIVGQFFIIEEEMEDRT